MLISSPAVEREWGWGDGLSNPWQMRGFYSKEWPWEFSVGQTRFCSKAGILFSVGSGRRFASARSQPGLRCPPPAAQPPHRPDPAERGRGRLSPRSSAAGIFGPSPSREQEPDQTSNLGPPDGPCLLPDGAVSPVLILGP
jgi:hypothetical protein